ncbi:MAG TPA: PstS family phosphate ABC transporter substrate-binding protein [Solirubrobacteraceae bacterium]|nr:PstS family phosphate ABC transporter substrate-binding protein [Solirubrobacteraceae bacterium]
MRIQRLLLVLAATAMLGLAACGDDEESGGGGAASESSEELTGSIRIDGSSTVFPFAQAAAELFEEEQGGVKITVGQSGTGGGFEKFCAGETDISDASRPIDEEEEVPICEENAVEFGEVQIANDGIAIATNKGLTIECMTTDQLKALWEPKSKVASYSDIDPSFPGQKVALFGPGTDSGTFEFFTEEITGEEGAQRTDYEASEDDNQLVTGVAGTEGGLGYFGLSYFEQNTDKLNGVQVDSGGGCVAPSAETVQDGSYTPLSRPLFMYPSKEAMAKPHVKAFMDFIVANQQAIAEAAQIVPLTEEQATEAQSSLSSLEGGA